MDIEFTVEKLLLNDSFLDYCRDRDSVYKNYWEQIIAQCPEQLKIIREAKQLLSFVSNELPPQEITNEINKIREIIKTGESKNSASLTPGIAVSEHLYVNTAGELRSKRLKKLLAYSAILIVLIGAVSYFNTDGRRSTEKKPLVSSLYENTKTKRKEIILPDGSVVILNSNSNILISPMFNQKTREVQLSGEAFFKVKKDPGKPFIVLNRTFSTTALGTSFYVHARRGKDYSVDLLEGKVKLESTEARGKSTFLTAGQEAQWIPAGAEFAKGNFDTLGLQQWVDGKISFDKTPLEQALRQLEKWYAVTIEMRQKKWGNKAVSGDYINVSLDDILKVICFTFSCKYTWSANKIIIE